jgi:CRP/FNR family transcriptional regulator
METTEINNRLAKLFSEYRQINFDKDEVILRTDMGVSGLFYLEDGWVKAFYKLKEGKEKVFCTIGSGSVFPLMNITDSFPNILVWKTLVPSKVRFVEKDQFLKKLNEDIEISNLFLFYVVDSLLKELSFRVFQLGSGEIYQKLLGELLYMVNNEKTHQKDAEEINLPVSQTEIAELIGVSRKTCSKEIEKLVKSGAVECKNKVLIIKNLKKIKKDFEG